LGNFGELSRRKNLSKSLFECITLELQLRTVPVEGATMRNTNFILSLAIGFFIFLPVSANAQVATQIVKKVDNKTLAPGATFNLVAECPTGKKVSGGGFSIGNPLRATAFASNPDASGVGWIVAVRNNTSASGTTELTAFAVCI
jgi:hypothetical protein